MVENSAIEWTDHTFSPWTGCLSVSPGCANCYAAALARRAPKTFGSWEPGAPRKRTSESYWNGPRKWNRQAERAGVPARVFCASMADVFDNKAPAAWREDLWALIRETPHLDWLMLTKRPQNIARMLPRDWGPNGYANVWLGTTAEDQLRARQRIPVLARIPAHVRFLSCEPLLGPLDLRPWLWTHDNGPCPASDPDCLGGEADCHDGCERRPAPIGWVIGGGESGPGFRPVDADWLRSLRDQCAAARVPFFAKQMSGARKPLPALPADLEVRQFPRSAAAA